MKLSRLLPSIVSVFFVGNVCAEEEETTLEKAKQKAKELLEARENRFPDAKSGKPTYQLDTKALNRRCQDDRLHSYEDAHKRNMWAVKCNAMPELISKQLFARALYFEYKTNPNDPLGVEEEIPKPFPMYPVYAVNNKTKPWFPEVANPGLKTCNIPADAIIVAFCQVGCFAPEQNLLFADGYESIYDAFNQKTEKIVSLKRSSTTGNIAYMTQPVTYIESLKAEEEKLVKVNTMSGKELNITPGHPVLTASGFLLKASYLKPSMSLVLENGSYDLIIDIQYYRRKTKVYNVDMSSLHPIENLVVADGLIVGNNSLQSQTVTGLNQKVLKDKIAKELSETYKN